MTSLGFLPTSIVMSFTLLLSVNFCHPSRRCGPRYVPAVGYALFMPAVGYALDVLLPCCWVCSFHQL